MCIKVAMKDFYAVTMSFFLLVSYVKGLTISENDFLVLDDDNQAITEYDYHEQSEYNSIELEDENATPSWLIDTEDAFSQTLSYT